MGNEKIVHQIRETEEVVAVLAAEALEQDDYDRATRFLATARSLAEIAHELETAAGGAAERLPGQAPRGAGDQAAVVADRYPLFRREDNDLVKVGWSKTRRKEYKHSVAWTVATAFVERVSREVADDGVFSMREICPFEDPATGRKVSDYQPYAVLAWLREGGLAEKVKGGYRVTLPAAEFGGEVERRWREMRGGPTEGPQKAQREEAN